MRVFQTLLLVVLAAYHVAGYSVKKDGKPGLGRYGKTFFGRQVSETPSNAVEPSTPKQSSSPINPQGLAGAPSLTPSSLYGCTVPNTSSTTTLPHTSHSSTQSLTFPSPTLSSGILGIPASSSPAILTNGTSAFLPGPFQLPGRLSHSGPITAVSPIKTIVPGSGNTTVGIVSSAQITSSSLVIPYTTLRTVGNLSSANTSASPLNTLSQLSRSSITGLGPFNTTNNATSRAGINQIASSSPLNSQQSSWASPSPLSFEAPPFPPPSPTTAISGPLTSMSLSSATNSSQTTALVPAAQMYPSPTMPANDVATTVFSLLPSGSLLVQLVSNNAPNPPQGSVSVVVVTQTAHRIKYVTVTIFHTKSVSGHTTTSAEITTIAVATEAFQTYMLLSPAASISPTDIPTPSAASISSQPPIDGESPFASSAIKADSTYATISGFRIMPVTSTMTIQFLGASPVTAVMASQSPASGPNQSFIPLWVPDMLGNAYGGGWIVKPPIWVLSPPESPVDVKGAVVKMDYSSGVVQESGVEALSIPSQDGPQPLPSSSFITLIPGMSYSFPVPMPPLLEPISVLVSAVQSEPFSDTSGTPSFDTIPAKPTVMSVAGNGSFISPVNPTAPLFSAFGGRATVGPLMCVFSVLAAFVLL